jgi:hypothetical protein
MKEDIRLELGALGILSGEQKRALECYIDSRIFDQRKTFDEYTLNSTNTYSALDLDDLRILAENFKVRVLEDSVLLADE